MRIRCGIAAMAMLLPIAILAAPPLSTVEDVLYKADGSKFNGVAFVEWKSFQAADFSNIAIHSVTVTILDGAIRVQLVPTTNASSGAYYSVRYHSDGRIQFDEIWAVPPSAVPLKLRDVRVATPSSGGPVVPPPADTEILESDVVGLLDDLAVRPLMGPGFAPSRAAFINDTGALEAVQGNPEDCVRVDGTAGPCAADAGGSPAFVDAETPAGLIDGSNTVFTLSDVPNPPSSLELYRNGVLQKEGVDYILTDVVIDFALASVPQLDDILVCSYRLSGGSGTSDLTPDEKAALAGTAGTPSDTNRYVTDEDPRMAIGGEMGVHALLGPFHGDTTPDTAIHGDLIVAAGAPAAWTRLPIGPANSCLMSNGSDAVWNTCLVAGFTLGSVPFVDSSGGLAQNNSHFHWDDSSRRLSLGNNLAQATLYLYDSQPSTGLTNLVVRAGQGQGANPLQTWLDPSGIQLGQVDAAGNVAAASFDAVTTGGRAAWRDSGSSSDPSTPTDGDVWYNTAGQVRRSVEGGQTHALPQVICSSTGSSTSSITLTSLGSCTVPAGFLQAGDRVDVRFSYSHEGTVRAFTFEIRWGASTILSRASSTTELRVVGQAEFGIHAEGALWNTQSWGASLALASGTGNSTVSLSSPVVIDLLGRMSSSTTDTVTLRNFTVIRYPAQANP